MSFYYYAVFNFLGRVASLVLLLSVCSFGLTDAVQANDVTGELKQWHRVTVTFDGPQTSETASPNPFTDYRLLVTFEHAASGSVYVVPGFYAADGNAAETSATSGSKWRVHFTPDQTGAWTYSASFRQGTDVAISLDANAGSPTSFNGASGSFSVASSDKSGSNLRGRGMLRYAGAHYFQFAGDGTYYIKTGTNSPENLLAYSDFDGTYDTNCADEGIDNTIHSYSPHVGDWISGDPSWKSGKGKGLIGALNYLSTTGVNSVYFLTYNIDTGDGCDVWPWTSENERERFDVSKLAQWEIVFGHMQTTGQQMHVVLTERENAKKLGPIGASDNNNLNDVRKLYYRELIARFGHHLAIQWNVGEENTNGDAKKKQFADYIRAVDPYDHPITVHTSDSKSYTFYDDLIDHPSFEATSLQAFGEDYNDLAHHYRSMSQGAGRPWAVYGDEQSPNANSQGADILRKGALWGMLMGGGAGVEWYLTNDLGLEDFRKMNILWVELGHARAFFDQHLPFHLMEPANELTSAGNDFVFALNGQTYAVYDPDGGAISIELASASSDYNVYWYNPRTGGALIQGSVSSVSGGGTRSIGSPPSDTNQDWAALITTGEGGTPADTEVSVTVVDGEAKEPGGSGNKAKFRISRTGDTGSALTVSFAISGSATPGIDYPTLSTTAVIGAGASSENIVIDPLNDNDGEVSETVTMTLTAGSGYTVASHASAATIVILDDDGGAGFELGDPSGNGAISALDASLVLQHVTGADPLNGDPFTAADVSGNGILSAYDASLILQYMVNIISCFPADASCGG